MIRAWPLILLLAPSAGAQTVQPAELPSPDYAGLQYVDSRGCVFARAGNGTEVLWVPRVSREGVPVCSRPPSGTPVPVEEEVGVQPIPAQTGAQVTEPGAGVFVSVGGFNQSESADLAQARLTELGFSAVRGRVAGGSEALITVFVGPFADLQAAAEARDALREAGFADAMLVEP
jgi:cell division septation protein DedD